MEGRIDLSGSAFYMYEAGLRAGTGLSAIPCVRIFGVSDCAERQQ
jgi:hypothetical protein